jgi:lipase maturation factor 1
MALGWLQKKVVKRFQRAKDSVQRYLAKSGQDSEPAYELDRPATYALSRRVFLHLLGAIYLVAFSSYFVQFEGLYGAEGLIPLREQLRSASKLPFSQFPTAVVWHKTLNLDPYLWCNIIVIAGMLLSALATAGYGSAPVMAGCWMLYLSLANVGDVFLFFQWDSLLLETGFLAILFAPVYGKPDSSLQPPGVAIWMLRFLLFKLMLMSGVVKVTSNDRTWLEMTALSYHFASQPIPTPLAWYCRQLPPLVLQVVFAKFRKIPGYIVLEVTNGGTEGGTER